MKFLTKILFTVILFVSATQLSLAGNTDGILVDQKIRVVQLYPNPATTSINVATTNLLDRNLVLTIYNFIGKKVDEIKINAGKINIPLDGYYRGLYVYQLRDKQGQLIESGKFQVIK